MHKPEIMSPAGYWPQLQAAIEAGADAVYFGLKHFTARAKVGFALEELSDVMQTLHQRGVKGYVTFNTLVFDHELRDAANTIAAIAKAGADSIIVQDVGIARLAHEIAPELDIHGSTQMSITSAEGVALAQQWGASRVVLARELSLDDIRAIRAQTDCELEIFVHGALCVSYSGQCFSSEAWGGRSANRGKCAQACRLPYELVVDEQLKPLGDARYLLSPGDLYALHQVPEIVEIGISALKIEGRYKDENYVALTTQAYRKAVDEAWDKLPQSVTNHDEILLEQVYSRGFGPHFMSGVNHQTVVEGRSPGHRGVLMGRVVRIDQYGITLEPQTGTESAPLKAGDGIYFDAAAWRSPEQPVEGGRIYHVDAVDSGLLFMRFGQGAIDTRRIRVGDLVWRTDDHAVEKAARPLTQATTPVAKQAVQVSAYAHTGAALVLNWQLVKHPEISVQVMAEQPLEYSEKRPLTHAAMLNQLARLGNTAYELSDLKIEQTGQPFVPNSVLNQLRREAVEALTALQAQAPTRVIQAPIAVLAAHVAQAETPSTTPTIEPQLHLLVRTPEQLDAALALKPSSITLDYLELYGLRPAVERVQAAGITARVASPRVLKPAEQNIIRFLLKLDCEILVRSGGLLQALQAEDHERLIGDFSLNTANVLTAHSLLELGLERITPTHDLNAAQVAELTERIGSDLIEVVAYQHLPVFHTEHCVFCRFLSDGTSFKDCGHPCEKHRVALRDVHGRAHPVLADVGCRNTVFGAEAQEASLHLEAWLAAGVRHIRLEFAHETAEHVQQVGQAFQQYLNGEISAAELHQRLQIQAPQGTTEGSLFVPADYLSIPLMS